MKKRAITDQARVLWFGCCTIAEYAECMARGEIKKAPEGQKAGKLLDDLRPSAAAYRRYRRRADGFLRDFGGHLSASSYKRNVRKIIFEHFDYIASEWQRWQEKKNG